MREHKAVVLQLTVYNKEPYLTQPMRVNDILLFFDIDNHKEALGYIRIDAIGELGITIFLYNNGKHGDVKMDLPDWLDLRDPAGRNALTIRINSIGYMVNEGDPIINTTNPSLN